MAQVVGGLPLSLARPHRQHRLTAVECLIWDFSSTQSTKARSGGWRYKTTMSRTAGRANHLGATRACRRPSLAHRIAASPSWPRCSPPALWRARPSSFLARRPVDGAFL
jgi:hypothetical protein